MHVILLAAGQGKRMGDLTKNSPKALVEPIPSTPIIGISLKALQAGGLVSSVLVVGGYQIDKLVRYVREHWQGFPVRIVPNPEFALYGPVRSIDAALDEIPKDADTVAIANGDTAYNAKALAEGADQSPGIRLLGSWSDAAMNDDVRIILDSGGRVIAARKIEDSAGGFVSAGYLVANGKRAVQALRKSVSEALAFERASGQSLTWHSIVGRLVELGQKVDLVTTPRCNWYEFDSPKCVADYQGLAAIE